eukprot:scaffold139_cov199-Alexandrium_tamarense.AAC.10
MNLFNRSPLTPTVCIWFIALVIACTLNSSRAFTSPSSSTVGRTSNNLVGTTSLSSSTLISNSAINDVEETTNWDKVSEEWELDCYSRPVLVDGKKKLWEILMTDSSGNMKVCRALPSNK